ncbi:hypothetical protein [Streptacidiphilus monticola]|uniref:GH18 domain-containing protein n=1 Tax=Streptacidiphilus monticola TaxID=2161674 RepID=A0ABW1G816_9ACTN
MARWRITARRLWITLLGVAVLIQPAALLWTRGAASADPAVHAQGRDAVWLGHAWVDGRKDAADARHLLALAGGPGHLRDLYVHTGPLNPDGSLDPGLSSGARRLVLIFRQLDPGVRVQAWLGQVVASEGPFGLRLDRPDVRDRIVASARQALDAGFAGVHLDLEPVHSGDAGFLDVLTRVHALTQARGAVLSVAVPQTDPLPPLRAVFGALANHPKWWARSYLREVARRVDQIAVMAYDSAMPTQALFAGYVAQQTGLALDAAPPGVDVLIGLPAYRADTPGHFSWAETVPAALRGARLGFASAPDRAAVALYVDFTATDADWAAYRGEWLARP